MHLGYELRSHTEAKVARVLLGGYTWLPQARATSGVGGPQPPLPRSSRVARLAPSLSA